MDHNYSMSYENVRIRPLKKQDLESLRKWRNDKNQTKFLRQIDYITSSKQLEWYTKYLLDKNQYIFAIEEVKELNRLVGSLALYDFSDDIAEIGKIQIGDKDAHGRKIGQKSLIMVCKIGFDYFNLKKIIASVHVDNIASYRNFEKIGFKVVRERPSVVFGNAYDLEILKEEFLNLYNDLY